MRLGPHRSRAGSASSQAAPRQIDVEARLHFPLRQELTFERSGEVMEVLVNPGDRVEKGPAFGQAQF